jgi:hypothetical protein
MVFSSPTGSLGLLSSSVSNCSASSEVLEQQSVSRSVGCAVSSYSGRSKQSQIIRVKPKSWVGPLPSPRVSPKVSLGDAMVKAKVLCSPSSVQSLANSRGSAVQHPSSEMGRKPVIRSEIRGAGNATRN